MSRMRRVTRPSLSPRKRRLAVSISQSTTPSRKTSARRSIASPSSCSGAMYASLPFSWPVARALDAARRLRDAEVERRARRRRRRRGCSAARRRDGRCRAARRRSLVASCAAWSPCERADDDARARSAAGSAALASARVARRARRATRRARTPSTRKSSPSSRRRRASRRRSGGWMRAASRASSRNIVTNSGSFANCGWRRLDRDGAREPDRSEEAARWTEAIPPAAISRKRK